MSTQNIDQMNGMQQVVMSTPTQAELNAEAKVKMQAFVKPNDIAEVPAIGVVIAAASALAGNDIIRLSKNKKLRMAHRGFTAIDQVEPWVTYPTYAQVPPVTGAWRYVAPKARPSLVMATTDDGIVITSPGTFSDVTGFKTEDYNGDPLIPYEDNVYGNNATSSSTDDGLVGPDVLALAADQAQVSGIINDMPGKTGGAAMTGENYLSFPGDSVTTSLTAQAALDLVLALVGTVNTVTAAQLIAAGIPANSVLTSKLASYRTDIQAASSATVYDIQTLQQLIVTRNHI